jgi:hypothetical protein
MGHKAVKSALVAKLSAQLPGWTTQGAWVARSDIMPSDGKRWPWVIVRTTRRGITSRADDDTLVCVYRCEVTVGVRSALGDRGAAFDEATENRDDLIDAVCYTLTASRGLGDGMRVTTDEIAETTAPSVLEGTGPAIAIGTTTFTVSAHEIIPPPTGQTPDPEITEIDVTVTPYPADHGPLGAS